MDQVYVVVEEFSTYSTYFLFLLASYFTIFKVMKIFSVPEAPMLTYCKGLKSEDGSYMDECGCSEKEKAVHELVRRCNLLTEAYRPPWLWGRNGHVQTAVYGLLGKKAFLRIGKKRYYVTLKDGTTVTFDVFEPSPGHARGDVTLALCPGIGSSSDSTSIRRCVHFAQMAGFRCAVLNHLGALKDEKLTSPRVFRYGGTEEYDAMMCKVFQLYPNTKVIVVGFSMGGNIVTKYLGERAANGVVEDRIIMGISICQGYDAVSASAVLRSWESGRRIYEFIMTENVKAILRRNYDDVIKPYVEQGIIDERLVWSSTSFLALDENYTRRVAGFDTLKSFYEWCSSIKVVDKITIPMVFLNALDDPVIPPALWAPIKMLAESKPNILFALTKHGGHLGFLEGTSFAPKTATWLDRLVVQLSDAAIDLYGSC